MVLGFLSVVRGVWAELREQRLEVAAEDKD
jgi:hypothetical protein